MRMNKAREKGKSKARGGRGCENETLIFFSTFFFIKGIEAWNEWSLIPKARA